MSRAAMQRPLEALIDDYVSDYELEHGNGSCGYSPTEGERFMLKDAIMGLIADEEIAAAIRLAAPQGEPVATVTSETKNASTTMSWWHEPALPVGTKLYASPPAREPLSRERIKTIFLAAGFTIKEGLDDLKPYVYEAARELERAHGIGKP